MVGTVEGRGVAGARRAGPRRGRRSRPSGGSGLVAEERAPVVQLFRMKYVASAASRANAGCGASRQGKRRIDR